MKINGFDVKQYNRTHDNLIQEKIKHLKSNNDTIGRGIHFKGF